MRRNDRQNHKTMLNAHYENATKKPFPFHSLVSEAGQMNPMPTRTGCVTYSHRDLY